MVCIYLIKKIVEFQKKSQKIKKMKKKWLAEWPAFRLAFRLAFRPNFFALLDRIYKAWAIFCHVWGKKSDESSFGGHPYIFVKIIRGCGKHGYGNNGHAVRAKQ